MKRKDEESCRLRFTEFLARYFTASSIVWKEVQPKDEPPDFYLNLNGEEFAVEVTALMENVPVGQLSLPRATINESLAEFVEQVELNAVGNGYLSGAYAVYFSKPIAGFRNIRAGVMNSLLDYIQDTANLDYASELTVYQQGREKCSIWKVHNDSDKVLPGLPPVGKREGQAARDLCAILNERIEEKKHRLRNITIPKILLLLDRYLFADRRMYQDSTSQIPQLASFHTVFVLLPDVGSVVLHSENSRWMD